MAALRRQVAAVAWVATVVGCGGTSASQPPPEPAPATDHDHGHHAHHGPIGHRFENAEEWVAVFEGPERDRWQKPADVVALLELSPAMTVADIGAGTGYFLPYLSRAVPQGKVLGLDIEPDMVRYIQERARKESLANVEGRVVAVDDPTLAARTVDRILIVNTWHHIPDRTDYARKLRAGLKEGGAVFIVDFTLESKHGPPREHRLEPARVIAELEEAGFEARAIDETLSEQYVVVGR
jgi:cyclopropane fatty-acyl-phospholipid synthase-like methyltransferase